MILAKKGLSEIITVLLLIGLSIAAVALIVGVIMPLVKNNLDEGKACFDATIAETALQIVQGEFSCYNSSSNETLINIKRGEVDMNGIKIVLVGNESKSYIIKENSSIEGVKMFYDRNKLLEFPEKGGGERTYVIETKDFKPEKAIIAAVIEDKSCKEKEEVISLC